MLPMIHAIVSKIEKKHQFARLGYYAVTSTWYSFSNKGGSKVRISPYVIYHLEVIMQNKIRHMRCTFHQLV